MKRKNWMGFANQQVKKGKLHTSPGLLKRLADRAKVAATEARAAKQRAAEKEKEAAGYFKELKQRHGKGYRWPSTKRQKTGESGGRTVSELLYGRNPKMAKKRNIWPFSKKRRGYQIKKMVLPNGTHYAIYKNGKYMMSYRSRAEAEATVREWKARDRGSMKNSRRKGKMPAGLAAYWRKKRAAKNSRKRRTKQRKGITAAMRKRAYNLLRRAIKRNKVRNYRKRKNVKRRRRNSAPRISSRVKRITLPTMSPAATKKTISLIKRLAGNRRVVVK